MMGPVDHWLDAHPNGQVRFDRLGDETKCTLEPERGDCYFGRGLTVDRAFEDARRVLEAYRKQEN